MLNLQFKLLELTVNKLTEQLEWETDFRKKIDFERVQDSMKTNMTIANRFQMTRDY